MTSAISTHEADARALYEAGLRASEQGHAQLALEFWRESLHLRPFAPHVHHLLGAEYVQLRRFGDAVLHMAMALEQDPQYKVARLQLALLWLTLSAPMQATQVLQPLLTQAPSDALSDFAAALDALAQGDASTARQHLLTGLTRPSENFELKSDMERLLDAIQASADGSPFQRQDSQAAAASVGPLDVRTSQTHH